MTERPEVARLAALLKKAWEGQVASGDGWTDEAFAAWLLGRGVTLAEPSTAALRKALRPLAQQDCESWGCSPGEHDCAPANARAALKEAP